MNGLLGSFQNAMYNNPLSKQIGGAMEVIQNGARSNQTSLPNVPVPGIGQGMYKLPDMPMQNIGFMSQPTGGYRWMGY